jgi:hypothetical protein
MDNHSRRLSTKPVARLRWVAFNRYASPSTDGGLLGSRLLAAEYTGQPPGADRWRVTDAAAGGSICGDGFRAEEVRFARDSPLEGDGFELPVPRSETTISASQRGNGRWRTQEASRAAAPTDPPLRLSRQPKSGAPPPESAAESRPFFTQRGAPGGWMRHRPAHLDAGLSTRRPSR